MPKSKIKTDRERELAAFLERIDAQFLRSAVTEFEKFSFYQVRGKDFILLEYLNGEGWNIFLPASDGPFVSASFAAVMTWLEK